VRAFYRETLGRAGFKEGPDGRYDDPKTGVSLQVRVSDRGATSGVVVTARTAEPQ
jgi:hypothetical protein